MSKSKKIPTKIYKGDDANSENEFYHIDQGDLSKNGEEEFAETKEGEQLPSLSKPRERRKAPSIEEMAKAIRMMPYEDRAAVVQQVRVDMIHDINGETEKQAKEAEEKRQALDRLERLKEGL